MANVLSGPVEAYFKAITPVEIADCFTSDAVVTDERRTHHGRAEILQWREEVGKISFRQDILSAMQDERQAEVTCRVSGTFKGSPVDLTYRFALSDGRISRLEIA